MQEIIITSKSDLTEIIHSCIQSAIANKQVTESLSAETEDQLLNVKQASKYLDLAVQTVYGLTSNNKIPFLKRGKKLYFKKTDLLQWVEAGKGNNIAL